MTRSQPSDAVITFAEGLPGFEASRQFMLVTSAAIEPFTLVQGVGLDAPSFLAIDPQRVVQEYAAPLDRADLVRLGADSDHPLLWLAVVTAGADGTATVNLRAPLVINPAVMRGIQMVAGESRYRLDHPLPAA